MTRKYGRDNSCGRRAHDPECLCDVKPLNVRVGVADLVNDMFMGRELCDLRGYGAPWTNDKIVDYFTDLCKFYDAYADSKKNPIIIGEFESLTLPDEVRHAMNAHAQIRDYVRTVYNAHGRTMSETLHQLGVTADEYRFALTKARTSRKQFTMETVAYLEQALTSKERPPLADLIAATGMTDAIIMAFARQVDERRKQLHGDCGEQQARELCLRLAHGTNMTPLNIVRKVYDETGIMFNRTTPMQMRLRKTTV